MILLTSASQVAGITVLSYQTKPHVFFFFKKDGSKNKNVNKNMNKEPHGT
jgi:hypothetical protein